VQRDENGIANSHAALAAIEKITDDELESFKIGTTSGMTRGSQRTDGL